MHTIPTLQAITYVHDEILKEGSKHTAERGYCSIRNDHTDTYAITVHPLLVTMEKKDGHITIVISPVSSHTWTNIPQYTSDTIFAPTYAADMIKSMYMHAQHIHSGNMSFAHYHPELVPVEEAYVEEECNQCTD